MCESGFNTSLTRLICISAVVPLTYWDEGKAKEEIQKLVLSSQENLKGWAMCLGENII